MTDAALLASKTKHLVWVISASKTRTDTLRRAREALAQVDAKILGVVLNRVSSGSGYGYYYYYYNAKDGTKQKRSHRAESSTPKPMLSLKGNGNGNSKHQTAEMETPPESLPE